MYDLKQGNCLEIMKDIPDESIDMILCDLPYGTTANKWDSVIPFDKLWEQYKKIIKEHGAIVLFNQDPFGAALKTSNKKMYRYDWIWQKHKALGFLNAKKMPLRAFENISVFYKKLPTYNPQMRTGFKPYKSTKQGTQTTNYKTKSNKDIVSENKNGTRYPINILKYKHDVGGYHPTQKPVALLEYLVKTYTNEDETVLDNTMGSGSTGVACMNTKRNFIGIEMDSEYYEIADKRIKEALDKK